MYPDHPTKRVPYVATGEVHRAAPKGAARPRGNDQPKIRNANIGPTITPAATTQAISHSHTLNALDIGFVSAVTDAGARGSGVVIFASEIKDSTAKGPLPIGPVHSV